MAETKSKIVKDYGKPKEFLRTMRAKIAKRGSKRA